MRPFRRHRGHQRADVPDSGGLSRKAIPMRTAMNEVLRDWYVGDCEAGVQRWNKTFERHGLSDRLRSPDRKFNPRDRQCSRRCISICPGDP